MLKPGSHKAMKEIFIEHGIPEKVISDNGCHYDSETFKAFAKQWGFDHITSSPTFAQSNGHLKRAIQTVKSALKKAKRGKIDADMALLCLRTTPINNHLLSPAELLYNRKLKGNLPMRTANILQKREKIHQQLEEQQLL